MCGCIVFRAYKVNGMCVLVCVPHKTEDKCKQSTHTHSHTHHQQSAVNSEAAADVLLEILFAVFNFINTSAAAAAAG